MNRYPSPFMGLLARALVQHKNEHPLAGTGPYRPPFIVDPGEYDPAGPMDVNYPGGNLGPLVDDPDLLGHLDVLYPGGSNRNRDIGRPSRLPGRPMTRVPLSKRLKA